MSTRGECGRPSCSACRASPFHYQQPSCRAAAAATAAYTEWSATGRTAYLRARAERHRAAAASGDAEALAAREEAISVRENSDCYIRQRFIISSTFY